MTGGGAVLGGLMAATLASSSVARAETPTLLWQGVKQVGVVCLVNTDRGVDTGPLHDRLCARVRLLTAAGSPVPVTAVRIGDPSILSAGQVTLLVHASTGGTTAGKLMAVTIRPFRNAEGPGLLFGAEPRIVSTAADDATLDAAIAVPLSQILPWRAPPGPRRIR